MNRSQPPLVGFNNNVRHRGRVFHIQTEDSGVRHARIVTHLFADGGRILKTTRIDYRDQLGREDVSDSLRRLMKEQHKRMFVALRAGELDESIRAVFGGNPEAPEAADATQETQPVASEAVAGVAAPTSTPSEGAAKEATRLGSAPVPDKGATQRRASLTRDQAATAASAPHASSKPKRRARRSSPAMAPPTAVDAPAMNLMVGTRPASVFDSDESTERSIFGDGLISEQSLDEVILSYLAEDLGEGATRK